MLATTGLAVEYYRRKEPHTGLLRTGLVILALGGVLTVVGRTGGPWCSADSLLQPHAGWHVLAAAALLAFSASRGWIGEAGYSAWTRAERR